MVSNGHVPDDVATGDLPEVAPDERFFFELSLQHVDFHPTFSHTGLHIVHRSSPSLSHIAPQCSALSTPRAESSFSGWYWPAGCDMYRLGTHTGVYAIYRTDGVTDVAERCIHLVPLIVCPLSGSCSRRLLLVSCRDAQASV